MAEGKHPWPMYTLDARDYLDIFGTHFPNVAHLSDKLERARLAGDRIVVLDLCGIARATSIGAEHSIGLTLTDPGEHVPRYDDQTIVVGDIFHSGTIEKIIDVIKAQGGKVHCIFFRPVGGLGGFGHHMRSHIRLYSALQRLYPYLSEEGDTLIELMGFEGAPLLGDALNTQSAAPFCEVHNEVSGEGMNIFTAHIEKGGHAPETLMTIDELRTIPGIEHGLIDAIERTDT